MGFGLLFIGFFFLLFMPIGAMGIIPNFSAIGCLLMIAAMKRLKYYASDCKGFKAAFVSLMPQTVLSLALFVFGIVDFGADVNAGVFAKVRDITELAADLSVVVTMVCICLGVYRLATSVELPRLASRSVRVLSFAVVHGLLTTAAVLTGIVSGGVTSEKTLTAFFYIDMASFVVEYAFIFICLAFLLTCYIRICLEGDEDMPYKEDLFDKILAVFKKSNKKS